VVGRKVGMSENDWDVAAICEKRTDHSSGQFRQP
jgi:hypothetical protein